jgi:hypothetical protein
MTTVNIKLFVPSDDGNVPASGYIEFKPTAKQEVPQGVVIPSAFTVELDENGEAVVELAQTNAYFAWRIREKLPNGEDYYVSVGIDSPVNYKDLVRLDPSTLEPFPNIAAWEAVLDEINANLPTSEYEYIQFNPENTTEPSELGRIAYSADDRTLDVNMGNNVILKVGQDLQLVGQNNTGSTILRGTPVMFQSVVGANIRIQKAIANDTIPNEYFMGVTVEDIANGSSGHISWFGKIRNVNTTAFNAGDLLYVSDTVAGTFTTNKPSQAILVAAVLDAKNNGTILVRPTVSAEGDGVIGADGKSAYELAVENGFIGTVEEWLLSLEGPAGPQGPQGIQGEPGIDGTNGLDGAPGADGVDGTDGLSAYEVAVANGFIGTEAAWLESLVGPQGPIGETGPAGADGAEGPQGPIGETGPTGPQGETGLTGPEGPQGPIGETGPAGADGAPGADGADGLSAYEVAVANGFVGTESEWLESLQAPQGSRATATYTTASLSAGALEKGVITMGRGFTLYKITTSSPARVRLYTTVANRDADETRALGIANADNAGLILEYLTTSSILSADLGPNVSGSNMESTPVEDIAITVTNTDSISQAITVSFVYIKTEE